MRTMRSIQSFSRGFAPSRIAAAAIIALAALAATPAFAQSLETFVGVVGGNQNGSDGCSTFGPPASLQPFFGSNASVVIPLGGIAACGYSGGISVATATTGPISSTKALGPTLLGNPGFAGSFSGTADATANYLSLGAAGHGAITGGIQGSSLALNASTGAAFYEDTLTASSPVIASLSDGFVRYRFKFDGSLSTPGVPESFNPGTAGAQLNIQHQGGGIFRIVQVGSTKGGLGFIASLDPEISTFTATTGAISGSGVFGSTNHGSFQDFDFQMNWNKPFDLRVGLLAWVNGSGDANFLTTATIVGIDLFDASHNPVTDFRITSASGAHYPQPVPLPAALGLLAFAVATLRLRSTRRLPAV